MRYLRMLTNAIAVGILGATYLLVLLLQLNPQVPTVSQTSAYWFGTLIAFYGLYLTVAIYLLILLREVLASRPLHPGWLSVRLVAWVGAACAAAAATITWANLESFRSMLEPVAAERMRQGAAVTTAAAVVLAGMAVFRYSFGRKGSHLAAAALMAAMLLSVAVPLWLRGPGELRVPAPRPVPREPPSPIVAPASGHVPRVRVLLLDGASLNFIRQRVSSGRLPNFGRLMERGAVVDLATLKPTQAEPVWAAAATGKYPPKTGVRSNAVYRVRATDADPIDLLPDYCFAYALVGQGFVTRDFRSSASLHARPIWDVLFDKGISTGIVNWPLTFPAHADRGYVISDRFDEGTSSPMRLTDAEAGEPTSAVELAREVFDSWQARPWHEVLPSLSASGTPPAGLQNARWDRAYSETAAALDREFGPRLTAVRYEALDEFGHWYLREARPELFGGSSRESRPSILDRYYGYIDDEIGRHIAALEPGDLIVVVSGFGMSEETMTKRVLARRLGWLLAWPEWSGTHEHAPDGFLLAYGSNVTQAELPRGAIVDLAPTLLYYLGLPVGRDMDGVPRTDLFVRTFTIEHPVAVIGTYEK